VAILVPALRDGVTPTQATRSGETLGVTGGINGGKPCALRAASQCGLCSPLTQEASNSRQVLERS
jgi:hypothetical protein